MPAAYRADQRVLGAELRKLAGLRSPGRSPCRARWASTASTMRCRVGRSCSGGLRQHGHSRWDAREWLGRPHPDLGCVRHDRIAEAEAYLAVVAKGCEEVDLVERWREVKEALYLVVGIAGRRCLFDGVAGRDRDDIVLRGVGGLAARAFACTTVVCAGPPCSRRWVRACRSCLFG